MPHRIWNLKKENDIIDVSGVSEDGASYFAWNIKLADELQLNREAYLQLASVEETIAEVKDGQVELLDRREDNEAVFAEISNYVKGEMWDHRLPLLVDYDRQLSRERNEEFQQIFEGGQLVVAVEKGTDTKGYRVLNEDAEDNKMHCILDTILQDPFAQQIIGEIVGVVVPLVLEPILEPLPDAIRGGIRRLKDRIRNERQAVDREETAEKVEKVIFIKEYKKMKEERER